MLRMRVEVLTHNGGLVYWVEDTSDGSRYMVNSDRGIKTGHFYVIDLNPQLSNNTHPCIVISERI